MDGFPMELEVKLFYHRRHQGYAKDTRIIWLLNKNYSCPCALCGKAIHFCHKGHEGCPMDPDKKCRSFPTKPGGLLRQATVLRFAIFRNSEKCMRVLPIDRHLNPAGRSLLLKAGIISYTQQFAREIKIHAIDRVGRFVYQKKHKMKKTIYPALFLITCIILSSCGHNPLARSTYRAGHHATKQGKKAQHQANRVTKHFWF